MEMFFNDYLCLNCALIFTKMSPDEKLVTLDDVMVQAHSSVQCTSNFCSCAKFLHFSHNVPFYLRFVCIILEK